MIAGGLHYRIRSMFHRSTLSCAAAVSIAVFNLLVFSALPDCHEESHSTHSEDQECIVCLLITGSIDPMTSSLEFSVNRSRVCSITADFYGHVDATQKIWVILSPRPPPAAV